MPRPIWPGIALAGLLLLMLARTPDRVAGRATQSLSLSPEEAIVTLKPYELKAADLPSGFAPGGISTTTPSLEAVTQAAAGADPYAALDQLQGEGTQVCTVQAVVPAGMSALTNASLSTCVMASPDAAQAVAAGTARALPASTDATAVTPIALDQELGDGTTGAWRVTSTSAAGQTTTEYDVRWTRGLLALELRTSTAPSQTDLAASSTLGATLDAAEATRPPVVLGAATVTPPASEADRVYTALEEQRAAVPASQPPEANSSIYLQDVVHPADSVRAAANPLQALHTVDEVYQRVMTVDQTFRTRDRQFIDGERITVDASAQGALAELNTPSVRRPTYRVDTHDASLPGPVVKYELLDSPIQLGDSTNMVRITVSYPNIPNTPVEVSYSIGWTHGRVFLQARYGTDEAHQPSADRAASFARLADAAFEASDLATMTADTMPPTAPTSMAAHSLNMRPGLDAVLPRAGGVGSRRAALRWSRRQRTVFARRPYSRQHTALVARRQPRAVAT